MRLLLLLIFIGIIVLGALHSAHRSAYVVIHRGQPMPRHYVQAWQFGNTTIVEVVPDSTTVTLAPWS